MLVDAVQVALTSTSLAAWRDSLSIVDFLHCFAPLCDTQAVSLAELNYAAAWPLDSQLLPPLYTALLSRLLLELVRSPGCRPCLLPPEGFPQHDPAYRTSSRPCGRQCIRQVLAFIWCL